MVLDLIVESSAAESGEGIIMRIVHSGHYLGHSPLHPDIFTFLCTEWKLGNIGYVANLSDKALFPANFHTDNYN